MDGILSCELGLLLNFGARKVEVMQKAEQVREDPIILSSCQERALRPLIRHRICEKVVVSKIRGLAEAT